jgi:glutamate 5-kinase
MSAETSVVAQMKAVRSFASGSRIVIKVGSALLVAADGSIRSGWLATLCADIAALVKQGCAVIIVSSGAIAIGARRMALGSNPRATLATAQAAASVGQIALAGEWSRALGAFDLIGAQMLLTLEDLEDRRRFLNATATLETLIDHGIIPVINENDSIATDEIRFGDNDRLAARVAQAAFAGELLLLSDVDGLYDRNPAQHPDAQLIPEVARVDARIMAMASGGSASGLGSGGMTSKLQAAQIATRAGIAMTILSGQHDHPVARLLHGGPATRFLAGSGETAHKAWLAGHQKTAGTLTIDAGAVRALRAGKSLLAAGITGVTGGFGRGDVVDICAPDGDAVARGLSEYDHGEVTRILGRQNAQQAEVLGYAPRSAVVHRNQMVMIETP